MVDEQASLAEARRARHSGERRRSAAAHLRDSGVSGERPLHRRPALSAAAPHAASAADAVGLRRRHPPQPDGREAARVAHRLAVGSRQGARAGVSPPQRQGEAAGRELPRRQVPLAGRPRPMQEVAAHFDGAQDRLQDSREAQDPLPADRRRRAAREGHRAAGRRRARLQRQHRAVLDARAGARQPHPAQDRGQGRCGGEGEGRGRAEAGQGRRRLRRAREEVLRGRGAARRTAATSTTSRAARWCRSSTQVAFTLQPGQISDVVKTQFGYRHHQGHRQEARHDAARSPSCGSS